MSSLLVRVEADHCHIECGSLGSHGLHPLVIVWFRGDPVQVLRPAAPDAGGLYQLRWPLSQDMPLAFVAFTLLDLPLAALRATWDAADQRFRTQIREDLLLPALERLDAHVPLLLKDADRMAVYAYLTLLSRMPSGGDLEEFARHHAPHIDRLNGVRSGILGAQEFSDKLKAMRPRYSLLSDANLPRLLEDVIHILRVQAPPQQLDLGDPDPSRLMLSDEALGAAVHIHDGHRYDDDWISSTLRLRCTTQRPGACLRLKGWREGISGALHALRIRTDTSDTQVQYDGDMFEVVFTMNAPARYHVELELPAFPTRNGDARSLGFVLVESQLQSSPQGTLGTPEPPRSSP
ncbi:hypothetical protein KAK07_07040 [Ideonella sp. 4Y16]|uniref:Uncharacterized protein n=1 Tax=Ideonella alba TaxID=2824118 RepID=A0A940Y6F1_9BURK|nr:hypothetical protein [Ideonella alba]MBQ0929140.1 hypothetical protein [Ideonella alba]MBQ0943086.1 hypothetical protein [Ideonella alba]